jgi:5-carboxymethyl-2-hydroxymuconate isomerase/predicted nucleic acid-binding protein
MPHLRLEYTDNVARPVPFDELFSRLHQTLARTAGVPLEACKSRAVCRGAFRVGEGRHDQAFVHLEIALLTGRPPEKHREIAAACLEILEEAYVRSLHSLDLQITVEVRGMERESYQKRTVARDRHASGEAIVVDTNCFVAAAFNTTSDSARILDAVRTGSLTLVWDEDTRRETLRIVRKIPPISWDDFAGLFRDEDRYTGATDPGQYKHVPDPDDRKFLALAEAAGATLITQDAHLLAGRERARVPVLTPGEFWARR